jgi:transglutaminase-like putative cysteine protease
MSMDEKSPRLELRELHQLQWLLGCTLVLLSVVTVLFLEIEAWGTLAAVAAAALAALIRPSLRSRVPRWLHVAAFPSIACFFALDLWLSGQPLSALIRLSLLLLLYRAVSPRRRREDMQLVLLGLFLLVVAGVLTVSPLFAVQLLLFSVCALVLLMVATVVEAEESATVIANNRAPESEWAKQPRWRAFLNRVIRALDWRIAMLGAVLFCGLVGVSGLLFVSIPRFQFENSLFLERFISHKAKTGFSETVRFGQVSEIMQDTSLALSVDISDPAKMPATPYFRMLVLDEYLPEGGFRLSPSLKQELILSERGGSMLRGTQRKTTGEPAIWTLYLETGVSRFLPLPGDFRQLRLKEPHPLQFSAHLHVAALRTEPVTMTAYRIEGLELSQRMQDPEFALRLARIGHDDNDRRRLAARLYLELPRGEQQRKLLAELERKAAGVSERDAENFARTASAWLATRHGYSLTPAASSGPGDPLLRWMNSREKGHCELFAGALVLLARQAGFPARLAIGFKGGSWNAYSGGLNVKNSDAHAWCEIWDGRDSWLRVDPTPGASAVEEKAEAGSDIRESRLDRSWSARLNSLRLFWYRRIVNFDGQTQAEALQNLREGANETRRLVLATLENWVKKAKSLIGKPWTSGAKTLAWLGPIGAGLALWLGWRYGTVLRWRIVLRKGAGGDAVRREAGHWLRKLGWKTNSLVGTQGEESAALMADLLRLRYGAPETWPDPVRIFREARRAGGKRAF